MGNVKFGFEDLEVWQKSVDFSTQIVHLIEKVDTGRNHYRFIEQLEACSTSIALNIAEGKGRYSKKNSFSFFT